MTEKERVKLSAATDISVRTIAKWDKGQTVSPAVELALTAAAKKLGLLEKRAAKHG